MRKEVKLGTAIGGVLVAVLIVYAVVNKGHSKKTDAVVLETGKPAAGGGDQSATPDRSGAGDPANTAHPDTAASGQRDGSGDSQQGTVPTVPGNGAGPSHSDDTADATSHSTTNWGTLLSAENPEIMPVHTSTPEPATDGAAGNNVVPPVENRGSGTGGDLPGGAATPSGSNNAGIHNGTGPSDPVVPHASGSQSHRIQSGETFSSISKAYYGDARYFSEIAKANPNVNPNRLRPGTTITLPDKSLFKTEKKEATAAATTPTGPSVTPRPTVPAMTVVDAKTEYRVQSTDSLYKISLKLYGTPNKVDAIYQLNKQLIGADPAKLKLNMVLKLPEPPSATTSATASR
jgi:nucleoid-associated protein YgaU